MKHGKVITAVAALVVIFTLSVVMLVMGQPVAAITTLIPSMALGVQHIVQATAPPAPTLPPVLHPAEEREREQHG